MQQAHVDILSGVTPTSADREQVRRLLLAVHPRMIRVVTPYGPGSDWTAAGLAFAVDSARTVHWSPHADGHDLVVDVGGRPYRFEVRMPAEVTA